MRRLLALVSTIRLLWICGLGEQPRESVTIARRLERYVAPAGA